MIRQWRRVHAPLIRVASFNVLADVADVSTHGFKDVAPELLVWSTRGSALCKQLCDIDADLVALIECTHMDDTFRAHFEQNGFATLFVEKDPNNGRGAVDGICVAFRKTVFELLDHRLSVKTETAPVAAIVLLQHIATGRAIQGCCLC